MKLLLTSGGIANTTIRDALVGLLSKPIEEASALVIPTAIYPFPGSAGHAWEAICGRSNVDAVGLYLDPPAGAVVLSVDEKTQIQALDRTRPLLPVSFGKTEKRPHDYRRHGTTNLSQRSARARGR